MGLLDEAIREHLELKRRRGGDPGEIAHQERAALEPVFADEQAGLDGQAELDGLPDPLADEPAGEVELQAAEVELQAAAEAAPADGGLEEGRFHSEPQLADFSSPGQETAELDMEAVLEQDGQYASDQAPAGPVAAGPTPGAPGGPAHQEDSLGWETPGRSGSEPIPEEVPGQERLSFE